MNGSINTILNNIISVDEQHLEITKQLINEVNKLYFIIFLLMIVIGLLIYNQIKFKKRLKEMEKNQFTLIDLYEQN